MRFDGDAYRRRDRPAERSAGTVCCLDASGRWRHGRVPRASGAGSRWSGPSTANASRRSLAAGGDVAKSTIRIGRAPNVRRPADWLARTRGRGRSCGALARSLRRCRKRAGTRRNWLDTACLRLHADGHGAGIGISRKRQCFNWQYGCGSGIRTCGLQVANLMDGATALHRVRKAKPARGLPRAASRAIFRRPAPDLPAPRPQPGRRSCLRPRGGCAAPCRNRCMR